MGADSYMKFNFNVAARIFGGFALVLILTLSTIAASIFGLNQINDNIQQVANVSVPILEGGASASQSLLESQIELIEIFNTGSTSDVNEFTQTFNKLKSKHLQTLTKLDQLTSDQQDIQSKLKSASTDINAYFSSADTVIQRKNSSLSKKSESVELTSESSDMGDEILSFSYDLEGIIENENDAEKITELTESIENTVEVIASGLASGNLYEVKSTISIVDNSISTLSSSLSDISQIGALSGSSEISAMQDAFSRFTASSTGSNSALSTHLDYLSLNKEAAASLAISKQKNRTALAKLFEFNDLVSIYTKSVKAQATSSVKTSSSIILVLGLIVIVISLLISYFVTGSITTPLKEAVGKIKKVATGDLTVTFNNTSRDEIGVLSSNMQSLINNLKSIITDISSSSHKLATTAEETTTISSQSYESVMKQKEQTEIISQSLTEMVDSVESVANSINSTLTAVEEAHDQAVSGEELLNSNIHRIQSLSTSIKSAADVIGLLNQETNNISSVLEVIRGVAEQTNLLALNAAIEAARAGEQGRGFAVVADEVRTLASRSHDSTAEIQELIERLLDGANKAVVSMDTSQTQTDECVDGIEGLGAMLSTINTSINSIKDMSQQISSAAEEQSVTAKRQSENISHISSLSELTSNSAEENRQASEELSRMAEIQHELVNKFKL